MGKSIYIAEKPSVAREFAKALKLNAKNRDGYMESENAIVTWCVGHLVTMSYPEEYDPALKKWSLDTLPFIPDDFKYEVIPQVAKQFQIVSGLLTREDVDRIYVCTDSGLIRRRKKKSCVGSVKQKIFPNMTTWQLQLI